MHEPSPGLPEFDYVKPRSLLEASQFLAQHEGKARPFLGGTDTFVRMRDGAWSDSYLVDVKQFEGMGEISFDPDNGLRIGAAVNMNKVIASPEVNAHYPLLAEAARTVASYQLRSRATIVGNLCNGSPAGDTTGACIVMGSVLEVNGVNGRFHLPLTHFFKGPGKTALNPGDIVTAITFPILPVGSNGRYLKLGRNALGDLAIVGVTAFAYPDANQPSGFTFRLALASVAPTPLVPVEAEAILTNQPITPDTIDQAANAAMNACTPISDTRGSARYRKQMVRNLTRQAVTDVWNVVRSA
ncbi:MAG: xanthine dehydrogenase family protein subunit M [Anaerolineae bacterium]|nr:xanthine dehydrogenase family protein subunit M [Anaerolineae bacterium]